MKMKLHKDGEVVHRSDDTTDDQVEQTLSIGNAVIAAIDGICLARYQDGRGTDVECILSAMVSVMAHFIAGIPDENDRQLHYQKVGSTLADMITTNVDLGTHSRVEMTPKENLQ